MRSVAPADQRLGLVKGVHGMRADLRLQIDLGPGKLPLRLHQTV
jgi:hypothetical protein